MDASPQHIRLHRASAMLELVWADGARDELPCEYLRVFSPSAELRGHGLPEPMLIGGKRKIAITRIEPVGRYAVRLVFDDGHDSGLYTWAFLRALGRDHAANWARYLARLAEHRMSRDDEVVKLSALARPARTPSGSSGDSPGGH